MIRLLHLSPSDILNMAIQAISQEHVNPHVGIYVHGTYSGEFISGTVVAVHPAICAISVWVEM